MNESPREEAAGDTTQIVRPVTRPPTAVIVMSLLWGSPACLEFLIWLFERQTFYLVVAFIAAVFTVLILKGVCWVFWVNLGLFALSLGITVLQLQIPAWAYGTPPIMLWIRALIGVGVIVLHQILSLRYWFGIRGRGKRWQIGFWLFVAGLTALGQYVLPTLRSLRD